VLEFLPRAVRLEKEIKGILIGKEEIKSSLLTDDVILYLKDHKDSNRKFFDLKTTFSKITVCKNHHININSFSTN
jgi:hypothetical protein